VGGRPLFLVFLTRVRDACFLPFSSAAPFQGLRLNGLSCQPERPYRTPIRRDPAPVLFVSSRRILPLLGAKYEFPFTFFFPWTFRLLVLYPVPRRLSFPQRFTLRRGLCFGSRRRELFPDPGSSMVNPVQIDSTWPARPVPLPLFGLAYPANLSA